MDHEPLGCLLRLVWLPYQVWKAITEQSVVGTSELDRSAGRFWRNSAIIATVLLLAGAALVIWLIVKRA
ncbi:MAG: hypothetical protein EOP83_24935 [Verrucomicrobiaceae bacterium]|nr:MAG: hypothetical protein EOP83_24935 [Verrucomicrobiaceae bacterium]